MLAPSAFPFQELLLQDSFFSLCHCEVWLGKNVVHGMHDTTSDGFAVATGALGKTDEVIDKDIHMCDGPSVFRQRDTIFGLRKWQCELCELRGRGSGVQAWSSGCGSGNASAEMSSMVGGHKGGCGPR